MDPIMLIIIVTIVAGIFIVDLYKRQNDRITSNLHADNMKQLLTISALECKFGEGADIETEPQSTVNEITQLINRYERGEIHVDTFQHQMDYLLNKYN